MDILLIICMLAVVLAIVVLVPFYSYTDKVRYQADRQLSCVRGLFDEWMAAVEALLSHAEAIGCANSSWREACSACRRIRRADRLIPCVNALNDTYKRVYEMKPDFVSAPESEETASLKAKKAALEEELLVFQDVYNEIAASYNKRLNTPVLRQCAAVLRKKEWEPLAF